MKSIIAIAVVLLCQGCFTFERDDKVLAEHQRDNGEKIKIYFVALGATTSDVIQVRTSNRSEPLWVSEKYNYLESSKLINETSLQLVLSDTGYHNHDKALDTIFIAIK